MHTMHVLILLRPKGEFETVINKAPHPSGISIQGVTKPAIAQAAIPRYTAASLPPTQLL